MKKFFIACLIIFACTFQAMAENWFNVGDGIYMDLSALKIENDKLHIKIKADDIKSLNSILKTETPGVMLDTSAVGHMMTDMTVDCKNPRYFMNASNLYDKSGKLILETKDETWQNDMTQEDWAVFKEFCELVNNNK